MDRSLNRQRVILETEAERSRRILESEANLLEEHADRRAATLLATHQAEEERNQRVGEREKEEDEAEYENAEMRAANQLSALQLTEQERQQQIASAAVKKQ